MNIVVCHISVRLVINRYKYLHLFLPILQAQLEAKEEQFDSENRELTEQIKKLSDFSDELNTLVNTLHTESRGWKERKKLFKMKCRL